MAVWSAALLLLPLSASSYYLYTIGCTLQQDKTQHQIRNHLWFSKPLGSGYIAFRCS